MFMAVLWPRYNWLHHLSCPFLSLFLTHYRHPLPPFLPVASKDSDTIAERIINHYKGKRCEYMDVEWVTRPNEEHLDRSAIMAYGNQADLNLYIITSALLQRLFCLRKIKMESMKRAKFQFQKAIDNQSLFFVASDVVMILFRIIWFVMAKEIRGAQVR